MEIVRDHHLMIATIKLRTAAVQRSLDNIKMPRFNIDRLSDLLVRQQLRDHLSHGVESIRSSLPATIQDQWCAVKTVFTVGAERIVGRSQERHRAWLSDDTWRRIDERKQLEATPMAERSELESLYRMMVREVQRSVRSDKRNYINALATEAEEAASRSDSRTAYKITKEQLQPKPSKRLRRFFAYF